MPRQLKIIVEKHSDGYVAYPLGLKGVVVGEGCTYEEALADVNEPAALPVGGWDSLAVQLRRPQPPQHPGLMAVSRS